MGIGNVDEVEHAQNNIYWPFDNVDQYNLAKFLCYPKIKSNRIIRRSGVESQCSWMKPGSGFKTVSDFKNRLSLLEQVGGEWFVAPLKATEQAYAWVPKVRQFYFKDTMAVLKDLIGDPKLAPYMKWYPEKLYDGSNRRLYTDLSTGDWWWRLQVKLFFLCANGKEQIKNEVNAKYGDSAPSVTIIPLILTSDKTHLSHSGKKKAWPVFMTVGNITERVRFSEQMNSLRAIGFLPPHAGTDLMMDLHC